jgi:hypothetical protein
MIKSFNAIVIGITGALSGALILAGCSNSPMLTQTEDVTDITITAESTGDLTFQSIGETRAAENLLAMSNPAPENLLDQPGLPSTLSGTKPSLAKNSAGAGFTIDTINGKIRVTTVTPGLLSTRYDTFELVMDETVFDAVEGNESITGLYGATVNIAGTIEYYTAQDRDGDKIINGKTGTQRASLRIRTVYTKDILGFRNGEETMVYFDADGGLDNDFDTKADNRLYHVSWVKLDGDDTLAYAFYDDADGDGVIAATGEGTIDVRFYESGNPLKPLVDYGKATIRLERDANGKDRTAQFSAEEKLVTGRLNRVWVVDESGDPTISAGEIAIVHFATNSPAVADSEITAQAVFTIDPGEDLGDESDNLLHEIALAKSFRFGALDTMTFHCTFEPPVLHGREPTSGAFELTATYRNGKTASLVGTFTTGVLKATYTGPEGNVTEVTLREGENKS